MDNSEDKMVMSANTQLPMILKRKSTLRRNRKVHYNGDNRVMTKRGRLNLHLVKIPHKSIRYVRDLWNTLVNMRWRWMLLTVTLVNVSAYLAFAELFLLDAWFSGDFSNTENKNHKICIKGAHNFTSFFMLGIETITTTGYGYFHPTEYCRLVFVILTFSTLVTIFIDGAFISVVYVKISRPTYKLQFSMFSKKAVICLRNGKFSLVFRINDRMGKHWINSQIKLFLVTQKVTKEGELLPNFLTELKLKASGPLFWPIDVVHEIDAESPFWNISARDLMISQFELLAMVTGSSVLTGNSSKSQTSYLNKEILWGFRFCPCLEVEREKGEYVVNKKNFNKTILLDMPLCSANYLRNVEREMHKRSNSMVCLQDSINPEPV